MPKHWGLPHWPKPLFQAGDTVLFRWGQSDLEAQILEDRGASGKPLRHSYFIETAFDEYNTERFEVSEEYLKPRSLASV